MWRLRPRSGWCCHSPGMPGATRSWERQGRFSLGASRGSVALLPPWVTKCMVICYGSSEMALWSCHPLCWKIQLLLRFRIKPKLYPGTYRVVPISLHHECHAPSSWCFLQILNLLSVFVFSHTYSLAFSSWWSSSTSIGSSIVSSLGFFSAPGVGMRKYLPLSLIFLQNPVPTP